MKLDLQRTFDSITGTPKWFWKVSILGFLCILLILSKGLSKISLNYSFAVLFIGFPIEMIKTGYLMQFIHNEINNISPLLPQWGSGIKTYIKLGIKYYSITISYVICLLSFFMLFIITPVSFLFAHDKFLQDVIIIPLGVLFTILGIIIIQLAICSYVDNFRYKHAFNLGRFVQMVVKVKKEIVICLFITFISTLSVLLISEIVEKSSNLLVGICAYVFISYFIAITFLFLNNLSAQIYKIAKLRINAITKSKKEDSNG